MCAGTLVKIAIKFANVKTSPDVAKMMDIVFAMMVGWALTVKMFVLKVTLLDPLFYFNF